MITTADLKLQTRRDLADLARQHEISGWHGMRKDELIAALRKVQQAAKRKANKSSGAKASSRKSASSAKSTTRKSSTRSNSISASNSKADAGSAAAKSSPTASKDSGTAKKTTRASSSRSTKSAAASKPKVKSSALTEKTSRSRSRKPKAPPEPPKKPKLASTSLQKLREQQQARERLKDLSMHVLVRGKAAANAKQEAEPAESPSKDRAILLVRDAFWLQVSWEVTRGSVQRAKAALGAHWHTAKPVLRLVAITDAATNAAEQKVRDIPIHGGVNTWYVDILGEPTRYRVIVGYSAARDSSDPQFYALCRSNIVESPPPNSSDAIDGHWEDIAEDYERIFSLSGGHKADASADLRDIFEQRLRRPMKSPNGRQLGNAADVTLRRERELPFEVDAELIVFGSTTGGSSVSLGGEPVKLNEDGTFTLRMELPDRRQVLPVVATSRDGMRQRTTIISVERNTKVMEPYLCEEGDL